jgi:hypothetical protein
VVTQSVLSFASLLAVGVIIISVIRHRQHRFTQYRLVLGVREGVPLRAREQTDRRLIAFCVR